jgi:hypothetical protein
MTDLPGGLAPVASEAAPSALPHRGAWLELVAYLVVGFGLFLLASFVLSRLFQHIDIVASSALYGANFLCFAGTASVLGVWRRHLTWSDFGLKPFSPRYLLLALVLAAAILPLRGAAAVAAEALTGRLSAGGLADVQRRLDIIAPAGPLPLNFALTLLGAGLLAPVAEELYFRGLIYGWFRSRFSLWPAVIVSSAIFALGHIDSIGVVASSFILGLLLALIFERSRSLWLSILVHAANNSLAGVLLYAALAVQGRGRL